MQPLGPVVVPGRHHGEGDGEEGAEEDREADDGDNDTPSMFGSCSNGSAIEAEQCWLISGRGGEIMRTPSRYPSAPRRR